MPIISHIAQCLWGDVLTIYNYFHLYANMLRKTVRFRADFHDAVMAKKNRGESFEGCLIRLLGNTLVLGEQKRLPDFLDFLGPKGRAQGRCPSRLLNGLLQHTQDARTSCLAFERLALSTSSHQQTSSTRWSCGDRMAL